MIVTFNPIANTLEIVEQQLQPHGALMTLRLDERRKEQDLRGVQCEIQVDIDGHEPMIASAKNLISSCETILCSARIDWPPETQVSITVSLSAPDVTLIKSVQFVTPPAPVGET